MPADLCMEPVGLTVCHWFCVGRRRLCCFAIHWNWNRIMRNWMWFRLFVLFPFVFSFTAPFEHSRLKCWTLLMALTHLSLARLLVCESAFFYVQPAIKCIRCISHSIGIVFCSAVQCWHLGNLGIQLCASNSFRDSWIYLLMHVSMQIDGHSEMPISRK